MRISSLVNKIKNYPKQALAVAAALLIVAVPMTVYAGFGPDRQTFDWNNNPGSCDLQANRGDRCGAISPVFDSFINTPSYGDERNFTRIAPVVANQSPTEANFSENQTAQPGQEYWVRTFVHNDANQNLNCTPEHRDATTNDCTQIDAGSPGIATGTKVSLQIASGDANGVDVMTKISADNATPQTIWDTATLKNDAQAFAVSYVPGSAVIYNGAHQTGLALPDTIDSAAGTAIGFESMDGNLPGCFNYSAYVYVKVKVNAPAITFSKQVRFLGEDSTKWRSNLTAKSGDQVQYLLDYKNTGTEEADNIVLSDQLPSNVTLVPGSVKWIDSNNPAPGKSVPDSLLFASAGVTVGNYGVNGGGYLMFTATVHNTDQSNCFPTNVAYVWANNVPKENSSASVTISDCHPTTTTKTPPAPKVLPNTGNGAGTVAGIFAVTTVAGALLHRYFLGRRFNS